MPNWTTNTISITTTNKAALETLQLMLKGDGTDFDFNAVTPMPKGLIETEAGSNNYNDLKGYVVENKLKMPRKAHKWFHGYPQDNIANANLRKGEQIYNNIKNHKHVNWYDWAVDNWGTKWNACEAFSNITDNGDSTFTLSIFFQTAWDAPYAILEDLSKKLAKDMDMEVTAEFEGGDPKEEMQYKNGKMVSLVKYNQVYVDDEGNSYEDYDDMPEDVQDSGDYYTEYDETKPCEDTPFQYDRTEYQVVL